MDDNKYMSISSIEEKISSDKYGMKIAKTIVEYISNKHNLNISGVYPSYEQNEYVSKYKMNDKELDLWLLVDTNYKTGDFNDLISLGVDNFINQYTTNNYNLYYHIFKILHEIGHCYFNKYLYELYSKTHTCYGNISNFCTVFDNILNIFIPAQVEKDKHIRYYLNPHESYANVFAYNHFYEVIIMLKNKNIIE